MNGFKAKIDPLSHGELNHTLGSFNTRFFFKTKLTY